MINKNIYNNENCLFIEEPSSDKLIIIFSGVNANSFTGYKLFSDYKTNKLFIRDHRKNWYNGFIEKFSKDADDLLSIIKKITDNFIPENITMFGSSMGGYAAILFGLKLDVGYIVAFGPQIMLDSRMPNNPYTMNEIIYDNLYKVLDNYNKSKLTIYFGSEDLGDIYHLSYMNNYENVSLKCIYGAPHDIMYYFNKMNLMKKVLNSHLLENYEFKYSIPSYDIFSNDKIIKLTREGVLQFYNEEYDKALYTLTEIVLAEPSWSAGWAFLGKIQIKLKLYDDALESLEKSFEIFYNTEHPHFDAGLIHFKRKDYHKSSLEFKNALKFSTIEKKAHIMKLIISLREEGKYHEAMKYLKKIQEKDSNNFGFLFQTGRLNLLNKNYYSAIKYFNKALEFKKDTSTVTKFNDIAKTELSKVTNNLPSYKLFASGDCILARRMHHFYEKYGKEWILGDLPSLTKQCDVVMTNLETVISNKGTIAPKGDKRPFIFRGSPQLANILLDLDINILTTANNHSIDYGSSALEQQKDIFNDLDIATPGSGSNYEEAIKPEYVKVGDVTLAFISIFTFWDSDKYCATKSKAGVFHITDKVKIINELTKLYKEANNYADLIILSPHWTKNWTSYPSYEEKQFARDIIDIGYDAIIGHSSHLLHGIELYKNKPIIYDMGTFLVDNISGHKELNNSACFVLEFDKSGFNKVEIYPLKLKNGQVDFIKNVKENNLYKEKFINLTKQISEDIFFADIDDKLVIEFYNNSKPIEDKKTPKKVYNSTKKIKSINLENIQKPNILLETMPEWVSNNKIDIIFDTSFKLIASKTTEIFRQGTGFLIENLLMPYHSLSTDRWEIQIYGKHIDNLDSFEDFHPISNGIYNPIHWEKNDLVLDYAVVRPKPNLTTGIYKLYFGFYNFSKKEHMKFNSLNKNNLDKQVYIGNIEVVSYGVPKYTSGIDWDGKK
ncbi:protein containing putative poly-gamma-glutamate capsule biosynthesis domain [Sulfurimonas gotlandica GD1]|uniref:Protein containing putative poly-gamma-glutamate capsule biosynthesis domain n=1 Tax=Sulfurimonas gotlandica (strain DSM 19862 / JCM 16533 / GD1) TaxID=929558 RepID=B6BMZ7_SULGG|nr:CapA family protein [Sulfurimonas gotlandica]EDZ61509.1 tetratricopeptide repeat domain protein [Sulfurimonas gotlandica GD1]EHP30728.1 protein containing putative poly-gamma-glutamate capsule biosynthesis domain [Sulfurimonas gotlandica GD1]